MYKPAVIIFCMVIQLGVRYQYRKFEVHSSFQNENIEVRNKVTYGRNRRVKKYGFTLNWFFYFETLRNPRKLYIIRSPKHLSIE